jgi:ketosteroid isomerase-like protein
MSQENVEIVRRVLELFRNRDWTAEAGFGERDVAAATELFHPDFELDSTRAPMADLRGKFRGLSEAADFWGRWLEAWGSIEFEYELTDAGEHVLATIRRQVMRGQGSGVEVELPAYWQVFTLREGRVARQVFFLEEEAEALEAAGLSE